MVVAKINEERRGNMHTGNEVIEERGRTCIQEIIINIQQIDHLQRTVQSSSVRYRVLVFGAEF